MVLFENEEGWTTGEQIMVAYDNVIYIWGEVPLEIFQSGGLLLNEKQNTGEAIKEDEEGEDEKSVEESKMQLDLN